MPARGLALERAIAAGKPLAHDGRDFQRLAVAELGQAVERLVVVGVGGKLNVGPSGPAGAFSNRRA